MSTSQAADRARATTAAALPLGNIIMFSYQLVARGHERDSLLPFASARWRRSAAGSWRRAAGPRVELVGGALLGGQLLAQALLALRLRAARRSSPRAVRASAVVAAIVVLLACGSLAEPARRRPAWRC